MPLHPEIAVRDRWLRCRLSHHTRKELRRYSELGVSKVLLSGVMRQPTSEPAIANGNFGSRRHTLLYLDAAR